MEKSLEMMIVAADLEDATEKNPVTPGTLLPAREMLGDLYMELNRPKDALIQYELSLKKIRIDSTQFSVLEDQPN